MSLYDFIKSYSFDTENNHYILHITTGTHVAQICWYLLIEAGYLPAKLIQSSPNEHKTAQGQYRIIDLDLSKYDALNQRFENEQNANWQQLKAICRSLGCNKLQAYSRDSVARLWKRIGFKHRAILVEADL